jgi:hypothetical protein
VKHETKELEEDQGELEGDAIETHERRSVWVKAKRHGLAFQRLREKGIIR